MTHNSINNNQITAELAPMMISFEELLTLRHQLDDFSHLPKMNQASLLVGAYRSKKRGRGIDFDQVRPYLIGDDVRNIDWKVTAKTRQAHTKLFYEEKERPVFILLDQSNSLLFSTNLQLKSTVCAKLGAMIGWWSYDKQDRFGGLVFNSYQIKRIPARLSKKNLFHFFHSITELNHDLVQSSLMPERCSTDRIPFIDPLSEALKETKSNLKSGSLIVVICDERNLSASAHSILKQLSFKNELLLMPVYDPLDHELPKSTQLTFQQGNKILTLNGLDLKTQQLYQQKVAERLTLWQTLVKESKASYYPISTAKEIAEQCFAEPN